MRAISFDFMSLSVILVQFAYGGAWVSCSTLPRYDVALDETSPTGDRASGALFRDEAHGFAVGSGKSRTAAPASASALSAEPRGVATGRVAAEPAVVQPDSHAARLKDLARLAYARLTQARMIDRYLRTHETAMVSLGAGGGRRPGWLCTDIAPVAHDIVFLDATRRFPFADDSIDYFVAEHMIEHVPLAGGVFMIAECFRTLKPGGVLRIATPDLHAYRQFLAETLEPEAEDYVAWSNAAFGSALEREFPRSGVLAFNRAMRAWGHQFIYDPEFLGLLLGRAGFRPLRRCEPGFSADRNLKGADLRQAGADAARNRFETMVVEAVKPDASVHAAPGRVH